MLKDLNPLLHSQLRLGIMSILLSVVEADFVFIKNMTKSTAGNLSIQLDKLKEAGYIEVEKGYKGKMPCTTCKITNSGKEAFQEYVNAIQGYLKP